MKRSENVRSVAQKLLPLLSLTLFLLGAGAGCETWDDVKQKEMKAAGVVPENNAPDVTVTLREGDAVKITFPSASRLDTTQVIRRDGRIAIPVLGEIDAAKKTPKEIEEEIIKQYGSQLVTKEVTVTLESSTYSVFVNGAVLRPGKVPSNRPLTALEAIMECGGFDYTRANLKNVRIIRTEDTDVKTFTLDFRGILKGKPTPPFYLKPSDIVYISERFTLF